MGYDKGNRRTVSNSLKNEVSRDYSLDLRCEDFARIADFANFAEFEKLKSLRREPLSEELELGSVDFQDLHPGS